MTLNIMSGPLTNLRKQRKVPFRTNRPTSSENRSLPTGTASDNINHESALLDEVAGNMAAARMSRPIGLPKLPKKSSQRQTVPGTVPTDQDLMSLMMTRVCSLEQRIAQQESMITNKDKKIQILEEKVGILQKARGDLTPRPSNELEKKCLRLQKKTQAMEAFLEDYGMIWAGNESDEESINDDAISENTTWIPDSSVVGCPYAVDYNLVIRHIQDLNVVAGDGVAAIQRTTDGARLKVPDPIPLTLYANGIVLFKGPFRSFMEPSTQEFIKDISDGFFPSELQHRFPEGIPFSVKDKRNVNFRDIITEKFTGTGQPLGGETVPSRLVPSNLPSTATMQEETVISGEKMTVDKFLNKLPGCVMRKGKVIDIRKGLSEVIMGTDGMEDEVILLETTAIQEVRDRLERNAGSPQSNSVSVSTLRIRSSKRQTFIVKMKFTETIGDLRKYLDKKMHSRKYEIMSTFPNQTYTNVKATIEECGLVPSATLHIHIRK